MTHVALAPEGVTKCLRLVEKRSNKKSLCFLTVCTRGLVGGCDSLLGSHFRYSLVVWEVSGWHELCLCLRWPLMWQMCPEDWAKVQNWEKKAPLVGLGNDHYAVYTQKWRSKRKARTILSFRGEPEQECQHFGNTMVKGWKRPALSARTSDTERFPRQYINLLRFL